MSRTNFAVAQVRPYRDSDEADVLDLLGRAMGDGPTGGRTSEFFHWKHIDNPFGRSFMLVAEMDGRIVGLRAFMRWRFEIDGNAVAAVRAVDTATHPDYRRMGIFARLTSESLTALAEEADLIFNTPNEKSLPGYLKLGWEIVGKVPVCIRPLRPLSFARGLRSLRVQTNGLEPQPRVEAEPAAALLEDAAEIDWLLERANPGGSRLRTARSIAFLRWRYGDTPFDYRAVVQRSDEGLDGFAIFRVRPRGRLWESTVVELVADPHRGSVRRQLLSRAARAATVDHVGMAVPQGGRLAMARSGFCPSPASATLVTKQLRGSLPVDPGAIRTWALSLGDVEVF